MNAASTDAEPALRNGPDLIFVPVSFGELIDKITILEIKAERILDRQKTATISLELDLLRKTVADHFDVLPPGVLNLMERLRRINKALWDIEDRIRDCERQKDFGPAFIELARSVYKTNDQRSALKRHLCEMAGSAIREVKSYVDYKMIHI